MNFLFNKFTHFEVFRILETLCVNVFGYFYLLRLFAPFSFFWLAFLKFLNLSLSWSAE